MLQNACEDKGSVFLRISVICGGNFINAGFVEGAIRLEKCSDFRLFVPKSVINYPKSSDNYLFRRFSRIVICSKTAAWWFDHFSQVVEMLDIYRYYFIWECEDKTRKAHPQSTNMTKLLNIKRSILHIDYGKTITLHLVCLELNMSN